MDDITKSISDACDYLKELLISKNKAYGNAALNSPFLLQGGSPEDAVTVRTSDKIMRLKTLLANPQQDAGLKESIQDTLWDLAGYCVLWNIVRSKKNSK